MIARFLRKFRRPQPNYFPPILDEDWGAIGELLSQHRDSLGGRLQAASALANSSPRFTPFSFEARQDEVSIRQDGATIVFPAPLPDVKFYLLVSGYVRWLERKYSLPGYCEVEPKDFVIDCGAYVGGFGLSAARKGAVVHLFEPDLRNHSCAQRNLSEFPSAQVVNVGLFDRQDTMRLNISGSSVEHSFLTPDDGEAIEQVEVEVFTIEHYCRSNAIEHIDFLKIEAEGVEIEVFDGLGSLRPRKIAIDVSPERDGASPLGPLLSRLEAHGYETQQRGHMLFGRLGDG